MEKIKVGKIVGTHGLKGEVKIRSVSDFAKERFNPGNILTIKSNNQDIEMEIVTCRMHKGNYLVAFKNYQNINLVEKFIGSFVYDIKDSSLLDEDEYFYSDLMNMQVVSDDNKIIGEVVSVYDNGAHAILNVDHQGKKVLIPYVDAFIKDVDLNSRIITVTLIKGLIDED